MDTVGDLLKVLRAASSQDSNSIKTATQFLEENEGNSGFHFTLLKIGISKGLDDELNVRWLAVLYLKNGIEKHWRSYGASPLSDLEKNSIRNDILSSFSETIQPIALQFAVIISKIARYDFPKQWPQLFAILIPLIQSLHPSTEDLKDNTVLLTYRYVMKELSSKQLPNDKKLFIQLCADSFPNIFPVWENFHKEAIQTLFSENKGELNLKFLLEKLLNILKSLRCMCFALSSDSSEQFFVSVLSGLKSLLEVTNSEYKEEKNYQKLIILHIKILFDAFESNITSIFSLTKDIVDLCKQCIFTFSENSNAFPERFIVNCMNIMKIIANKQDKSFFSQETIQELLRCLVFHLLPLSKTDLKSWEEDAEEFCNEEIGETWRYNLRPCTEILYMTFLHQNPDQLVPVILSTLETASCQGQGFQSDSDLSSVLLVDAVYLATGLACNELFDSLDFEGWFMKQLLPQVESCCTFPFGKIIHRRVLWLIEQWMGVKPPYNITNYLYDFIIKSMDRSLDMAVRLSAASTLRQVLDDYDFNLDTFSPYQENCTDSLYHLLSDIQSGDTKMRVLHVLSFVIERLGPRVVMFIEKLAKMLPPIWASSESHSMLRCAVIVTLINVVVSLGNNSSSFHPFLFNVIYTSTDVTSPAHIYLLADGLDLWLAVLHNASEMTDGLLQLFNNIYELFEISSESLKQCIELVECYAVLGGERFLGGRHGSDLALALSSFITDVKDECLIMVVRLIETVIRVAPSETPYVFQQYLGETIESVLRDNSGTVLATARLVLVARLAFQNLTAFWNFLGQKAGARLEEATLSILRIFTERIDSVVETPQRKIVALACLSILGHFKSSESLKTPTPLVLCMCLQVLHDVCDEDKVDTLVVTGNDNITQNEDEDLHSMRMRQMVCLDPNHHVSLPSFLKKKMDELVVVCGTPNIFHQVLVNTVDGQVLQELQRFL